MEQQLDPKSVWLFFSMIVVRFGFVAIWLGFMFTIFLTEFSGLSQNVFLRSVADRPLAFVILGLTLAYAWAYLTYRFYRYELREDGFRKEFGVIWKKYVTIPYEKIQNVDIYRGLLARLLGLSDVHIQTAGASAQSSRYGALGFAAEGRLPGLPREVAEQLRDELVKRARSNRNTIP